MNRSPGRKPKKVADKAPGKKKIPATSAAAVRGKLKDEPRTLALLWATHERGGRAGLTVPAIVSAAVKVADEEGFEAVSMRRLADALEVGTMSLYTHVPGKAELTDLMIDAVYSELYETVEDVVRQPGGYREQLHFVAERNWSLYLRHPWLLDVPLGRPVLGPHTCVKYEAELRVLDGIGLTALQVDSIASLLSMHVQSSARLYVMSQRVQQADGMTEMEWWAVVEPMFERVRTTQFPVATRIATEAWEERASGPSSKQLFGFGLEVIYGAVAAMVTRNSQPG